MYRKLVSLLLMAALVLVLLPGCDSGPAPTPTTPPPPPTRAPGDLAIESATELGVMQNPPSVRARDGGLSAFVGTKVLWIFGDTLFTKPNEQGINSISNSAAFAPLASPFAITSTESATLDATGAPMPLLPYNQEELDYNKAHGDKGDDRYALWPTAVIRQRDSSGLVVYSRLVIKPGNLNFTATGSGLARVDREAKSTVAVRDPALLFEAPDPLFGQGAVVGGSHFYLYACELAGPLDARCKVARAPVETVGERAAYRFWDGKDWVEDINKAAVVLRGPTSGLTVSWNPYLGSYLATYGGIVSTKVLMRTAPAPEGPWSEPVEAFTGQPPSSMDWNYNAYEHPEIARDGGKTLYVTYYRPIAPSEGELRIVEVKLK